MSAKRKTKVTNRSIAQRKMSAEDLLKIRFVGDPQVSPDGSSILFCHKQVGSKNNYLTNLWVVPAAKGQPRQFTSGEKDSHGRWSPDGKTIAFIADRDDSSPQIHAITCSGGEAVPLTNFPEGSVADFQWSPDGTMLAVRFRETDPGWTKEAKKNREETGASLPARVIDDMYYRLDGDGYFNGGRYQLYIVDVASGKHRLLFDKDTSGWFQYGWSPNSKELVISANTDKDALIKFWKWDLYRVVVRSGTAKKIPYLPTGVKSAVSWSPDGKQIAFAGCGSKDCWGVDNTHLFLCDISGRHLQNLTGESDYCLSAITLSDTSEAAFEEKIFWSPDGKRVYLNFGWHGATHIASVGTDGGEVVFHTSGRKSFSLGNISSDGKLIAVALGDQTSLPEVGTG